MALISSDCGQTGGGGEGKGGAELWAEFLKQSGQSPAAAAR